ncbi:MAG: 1,2-phenylacetyl-CoA epoxidase subunit PaaE [Gammaproteobacteria bacterium]
MQTESPDIDDGLTADTGFYPLRVAQVTPETDEAVCIRFHVPDELADRFRFKQGQYLTLRTMLDGREVRRSYSICSGVDDGVLEVAIKKMPGGLFSTYANDELAAGDTLEVMPPRGTFYTELDPKQTKNYMCIAAGSGITPVLSIIKSILSTEPESRVTLIYGNRRTSSIMFRDRLGFLKNRYMDRFNWINVLSREEQDAEVLHGRINNRKGGELQQKHLIDIGSTDEFFLCGPESMISEVSRGLRAEGIDESCIHYELFYSSAEDAQAVIEKHHARVMQYAGKISEVVVKADGRSISFELSADGENILDAAMSHGADLPFSCKGGVCATCKARLVEGEVDMDLNHALSGKEVDAGMILTCQAHPVSDKVVVDFDG